MQIWARFSESTAPRRQAPVTRQQKIRNLLRLAAADDRRHPPRPITLPKIALAPVADDDAPV